MQLMFDQKKFIPSKHYKKLFMNKSDILEIYNLGHTIGLHSHSHPTLMEELDKDEQYNEYKKNKKILKEKLVVT